jgi:hypothetical protein
MQSAIGRLFEDIHALDMANVPGDGDRRIYLNATAWSLTRDDMKPVIRP